MVITGTNNLPALLVPVITMHPCVCSLKPLMCILHPARIISNLRPFTCLTQYQPFLWSNLFINCLHPYLVLHINILSIVPRHYFSCSEYVHQYVYINPHLF